MNGDSSEMLQSLAGNCTDMSVLERQRARQQEDHFLYGNEFNNIFDNFLVKPDPGLDKGWPDLGPFGGFGIGPGGFGNEPGFEEKQRDSVLSCGEESFKKRKAEKNPNLKGVGEKDCQEKKMKTSSEEGDSKITEQNSNIESKNTNNKSKKKGSSPDNSKISEVQKPDYIHVRARRGQATDSHSLAERVRREKISERMKYLQDLVPGCNKITGKAGMLDEIINYVQSLQRQVEFLSMKLATVNPTLDFNIENLFAKEVFSACPPNFPIVASSETTNTPFLQFNPLDQLVSCNGLDMGRTISAPVSIPETFFDSSTIFNQIQTSQNWDANLQSINYGMDFVQGRSISFPPHQFAGVNEASNMKMEMM